MWKTWEDFIFISVCDRHAPLNTTLSVLNECINKVTITITIRAINWYIFWRTNYVELVYSLSKDLAILVDFFLKTSDPVLLTFMAVVKDPTRRQVCELIHSFRYLLPEKAAFWSHSSKMHNKFVFNQTLERSDRVKRVFFKSGIVSGPLFPCSTLVRVVISHGQGTVHIYTKKSAFSPRAQQGFRDFVSQCNTSTLDPFTPKAPYRANKGSGHLSRLQRHHLLPKRPQIVKKNETFPTIPNLA